MPTCHVCESKDSEPVLSVDGGILSLLRCRACGFVFLSSWERSLAKAHELYDYYSRITDADLGRRHSQENRARQQALLREIARYARGRSLLDVGCGDGQLLKTAEEEGWEAKGIDLSAAAVELCRRQGLDASQTDFFDASLDLERFDAIVMSELVEHVPAPQRFLGRASELLAKDGILYLTTPNFGSLSRRLLGEAWSVAHPEHIGYFERSTLRKMAHETGNLRELRIDANNFSPSTLMAWWHARDAGATEPATATHRTSREGLDQRLRRRLHQSPILSAAKNFTNRLLSRAGLGDTLVAWLQKTTSERMSS